MPKLGKIELKLRSATSCEFIACRTCDHCSRLCEEGMTGADYFACCACYRKSALEFGPLDYKAVLCDRCAKREVMTSPQGGERIG